VNNEKSRRDGMIIERKNSENKKSRRDDRIIVKSEKRKVNSEK
jgi:hypothetical protein